MNGWELIIDEAEAGNAAYLEVMRMIDKSEKTYSQWELKGKQEDGSTLWKKGLYYLVTKGGHRKIFREPLNEFI